MTKTTRGDGPFDTLEATFRLACRGPKPWSIDGRQVPGLPDRPIPLDELRAILLHPSTSYRTQAQALAILVTQARAQGGAATVGLAGVLIFGLRRAVAPLCDIRPDRAADIEAEALAGLVEAIAATGAERPRLAARLCWMARNRAKRLFETELAEQARPGPCPDAEAPPFPAAHPDLVLAQAVTQGVIVPDDAALIGDTRFGLIDLEEAAVALGISYPAARKRRTRAEKALAGWLASDTYQRDFVPKPGRNPYLGGAGRPRGGRDIDRRSKTCQ
ncbi:MAG: hypothetical protein ACYCUG_14825 [Acidimicrobiales bacterium]